MIDYKQSASDLVRRILYWQENTNVNYATEQAEEFLSSFAERVRNDAIEECAMEVRGSIGRFSSRHVVNVEKRILSLKQKTNGTD